eukprot:m51a1_g14384 hypothetical protein (908) ;mRNA; f:296311-300861
MGNIASSRREVSVTITVRDLWAEITYVETLQNLSDSVSDALLEIPMSGLLVTSFSADIDGDARHVTSSVRQRARRRFTSPSDPGLDETLLVELCAVPARACVRIRVAALARVVPASATRAALAVPARAIGREEPAVLTVAVESAFARRLTSAKCPSHPATGVIAKGPSACAFLLRSTTGLEGRDFECVWEFAEAQEAQAVISGPVAGERGECACFVSLCPDQALHALSVAWPPAFGVVRQSPDTVAGLLPAGSEVVVCALFDCPAGRPPADIASLTVALPKGQVKTYEAPLRPAAAGTTAVHQLAARETVRSLMSGAMSGSPQECSASGTWRAKPVKTDEWNATLKQRLISLGLRWGLVTPYTAFSAEEQRTGRPERAQVFCRSEGGCSGLDLGAASGLKSCTLPTGQSLGAKKSIKRDLELQGKHNAAESVVDTDDRVVRDISHPETKRLDADMLWSRGTPSVSLLRKHFGMEGLITCEAAEKIIYEAREIFRKEPNVLELSTPISVCGDIHGQYYDLLSMLKANGYPSAENKYLFLGDYVDRGYFSTEVLLLLCLMKIAMPTSVYLLRGNHESRLLSQTHTFETECDYKYNYDVCTAFETLFDSLPLAALVRDTPAGTCFCVHGGISPDLHKVADINAIDRFREIPEDGLFCDLLWSDPLAEWNPSNKDFKFMLRSEWDNVDFIENRSRKLSYYYGPRAVSRFLAENNIGCVVRGHQVQKMGYMEHFVKDEAQLAPVLTIFTAPNYCDKYCNRGALLKLTSDGFKIRRFRESQHPFVLPQFMDAITYSLPFFTDQLATLFQALASSIKSPSQERTAKEIEMDKALDEKIAALQKRQERLKQAQEQYLSVLSPSYHKNIGLFDKVLEADRVNEGRPLKQKHLLGVMMVGGRARSRCDSLSALQGKK